MEITEQEIKDKATALRNLVSFKKKSDEYILDKARELLEKEKSGVDMVSMFTNRKEIKRARILLEKYLEDYTIESISDKNTLKEVIYLEIVQQRLQEKLNEYYDKDSKAVPIQLVETIHKNSEAILKLKTSLGLNREKEQRSSVDILSIMKVRFKPWLRQNQASRTLLCPHEGCGQMIMLKIRTEEWEAQKHPFFKDRILGNVHLVKLYQNRIITKEDVAKILEASDDYVDWLIDKWQLEEKPANLKEEGNDSEESSAKPKSPENRKKFENCCPKCNVGFLFCSLASGGINWEESCSDCDYTSIHECRRKEQTSIDFTDRRKKE